MCVCVFLICIKNTMYNTSEFGLHTEKHKMANSQF